MLSTDYKGEEFKIKREDFIHLSQPHLMLDSIVDGLGIRAVMWTQGCPHNCKGCHNPQTHSFAETEGVLVSINSVLEQVDTAIDSNQDGLTISGGEPFSQPNECRQVSEYAKSKGLNIWCYTGYLFENILNMSSEHMEFLKTIDILVDGKFDIDLKSLSTRFRGSKNQRIINVPASLASGKTIVIEVVNEPSIPPYKKDEGIFC